MNYMPCLSCMKNRCRKKDANLHWRSIQQEGLLDVWKLKPGALSLYMGDGHRATVEAIGNFSFKSSHGIVIVLTIASICSQKMCFKLVWKDGRETLFPSIEMAKELLVLIQHRCCEAFVKHDTLTKPDKLDPRSFKSIFIGYPKETMGYSFYSPSENKVFVARNAEFFESKLLDLKASGSVEDFEVIQEEDTNPSVETSLNHEEDDQEIDKPQSDINPIRRSTRTRRPTDRLCLYIDTEEHELGDLGEPANYRAALLDPESKKWLDAMNVEMQSKMTMMYGS
ncbi:retrotransposon protein, putative, ty1-copia subclass [Tanacetum coccineum]